MAKVSEIIKELIALKEEYGDLNIVMEIAKGEVEDSVCTCFVSKKDSHRYKHLTISKGCKCLSCWEWESYNEDLIVIY